MFKAAERNGGNNERNKCNENGCYRFNIKEGNKKPNIVKLCVYFSGGKKYERAKCGVSLLISKKLKGSVKISEVIDENILKLDMKIWDYKLTIIVIYIHLMKIMELQENLNFLLTKRINSKIW